MALLLIQTLLAMKISIICFQVILYQAVAITLGAAFMANFERTADDGWYSDSGATRHLTNNMENL